MKKILCLLLSLIMIFSLIGCEKKEETNEKQIIVTTSYITYTLTKEIVGSTADVILIEKLGDEGLQPKDLKTIREADILIYEGDSIDPWVGNILAGELKDVDVKTINAAKGIILDKIQYEENLFITKEDPETPDNSGLQESLFNPTSSESSEVESSEVSSESSEVSPPSSEVTPPPSETSSETSEESTESTSQPTSEVSSETSETPSEQVSENTPPASELTEEEKLIRNALNNLNLYDVVEYLSPIREALYDLKIETGENPVKYSFNGEIYSFAYSKNYDAFFYLGKTPVNAYTAAKTDNCYWFNFDNVRLMAENIKESINLVTEEHSSLRNQNYNTFLEKLTALEEKYDGNILRNSTLIIGCEYIPATLIKEYNLFYCAPSNGEEITLTDKSSYYGYLERNAVKSNLMAIMGDKLAEEFAKELGLNIAILNTLEEVDDIEKTYFEYMEANLTIITSCLT